MSKRNERDEVESAEIFAKQIYLDALSGNLKGSEVLAEMIHKRDKQQQGVGAQMVQFLIYRAEQTVFTKSMAKPRDLELRGTVSGLRSAKRMAEGILKQTEEAAK